MAEEDPTPPADGDGVAPTAEDTEAKPPPMEPLTPEILTAFYTNLDTVEDPDVASDDLATALGVPDRTTDSRNGSRVDFIFNTLDFARDAGYTPAQTIAVVEHADVSDLRAACDAYEKQLLEAALKRCRFNQRTTRASSPPPDFRMLFGSR